MSVREWCDRAVELTDTLKRVVRDFRWLSESYEPMRDIGYANNHKEQIDTCYHDLVAALNKVKGLQAGGKRGFTRRSRRRH